MKKSGPIKAATVKKILSFMMVLIIVGSAAGFYFGLQIIKDYAMEVSRTVQDSNASGTNIEQLSELKTALAEREVLVAKAATLFATKDNYQSQSLKDIQKYANVAGLTISSTEFDTPPVVGAPPAANQSVVVTLQNPVSYTKLITFLEAIEGNLPKMQVTGVNLSRPPSSTADTIVTDKITITVATR